MRRRDLIGLLATASVWPRPLRAEQGQRLPLVGFLMYSTQEDPPGQKEIKAFKDRLDELGWKDEHNFHAEYRWFEGDPARARALAKELLSLKPNVIVASATPGLAAVAHETQDVPLVFVAVSDPVRQGFVRSLAHPGGNITGVTLLPEFSISSVMVQVLKEIAPVLNQITAIFHAENTSARSHIEEARAGAAKLDLRLVERPARSTSDIENIITALRSEVGSGLLFPPDPFTIRHRSLILQLVSQSRVPAVYPLSYFVEDGGLLSYGIELDDLYRRSAEYVDLILKGASPASLPIQRPTKTQLVLNMKTARRLGLTVPPTLIARADQVIE